jgi:hypothetical protein
MENIVRASNRVLKRISIIQTIILVIVAVTAAILAYRDITERQRVLSDIDQVVSAQCGFYAPLVETAPPPQTTEVGARLLIGARTAMHAFDCQPLPPPSKELLQLAAKYGLKVPY